MRCGLGLGYRIEDTWSAAGRASGWRLFASEVSSWTFFFLVHPLVNSSFLSSIRLTLPTHPAGSALFLPSPGAVFLVRDKFGSRPNRTAGGRRKSRHNIFAEVGGQVDSILGAGRYFCREIPDHERVDKRLQTADTI